MRRPTIAAVAGILLVSVAEPALTCAYHAQPAFDLFAAHPEALMVAIAVRDARRSGILPAANKKRIAWRPVGYGRTARHIQALEQRWVEELRNDRQSLAFSLMIVEPALWGRVSVDGDQHDLSMHTTGPEPGDPIVFVAEAALAPIISGELNPDEALDLGLIRLAGDRDGRLFALLSTAGL